LHQSGQTSASKRTWSHASAVKLLACKIPHNQVNS
jgi:hypothetical protein